MRRVFPVLGLVFALACQGSVTQPTWDGYVQVSGTIRDSQTDAPVAGAHIEIGASTADADEDGNYSFVTPMGDKRVTIDGEQLGVFTLEYPTYRGDFYVHTTGCVARYGSVFDDRTHQPVFGAIVKSPYASDPAVTDATGWFRLSMGCPGSCLGFNTTFVYVTHTDYVDSQFIAGRGICGVQRVEYRVKHR